MIYNKTQLIGELRINDKEHLASDRPLLAQGTSQKRDRKRIESQTKTSAVSCYLLDMARISHS